MEDSHPMHRMPMSGIFELFVPGAVPGDLYKYQIKVKGGMVTDEGRSVCELPQNMPPATAVQ